MADEILAKRDEERGRKRDLDREDAPDGFGHSAKRARSLSSRSTKSVSTISTNRSASASPDRHSKHGTHDNGRRTSSVSPPPKSRKRRYSDASDNFSASSYSSGAQHRSRSREWTEDRNIRRRRRESSPGERGRHRDSGRHGPRKDRRSQSVDQSQIAKERRSMTPEAANNGLNKRSYRDRASPSGQTQPSQSGRSRQDPRARPAPPRERSLSPYSKRLALTQSMNLGR